MNRHVRIPEGHCWVQGDHSRVSIDSNHYGPVSLEHFCINKNCFHFLEDVKFFAEVEFHTLDPHYTYLTVSA